MTMEPRLEAPRAIDTSAEAELLPALAGSNSSNLAALLDRFTDSVTAPQAHTVGDFSETIQALHGELAMLARHFGAGFDADAEVLEFDAIFPETAANLPIEPGLAASEELEHLCRELSRDL
jgi:hypothetical protein